MKPSRKNLAAGPEKIRCERCDEWVSGECQPCALRPLTARELLIGIGHREGLDFSEAVEPNWKKIRDWWVAQDDKAGVIRRSVLSLKPIIEGTEESVYPGMVEYELLPILEHLHLVDLNIDVGAAYDERRTEGMAGR